MVCERILWEYAMAVNRFFANFFLPVTVAGIPRLTAPRTVP